MASWQLKERVDKKSSIVDMITLNQLITIKKEIFN